VAMSNLQWLPMETAKQRLPGGGELEALGGATTQRERASLKIAIRPVPRRVIRWPQREGYRSLVAATAVA
jgi:hypothetical protein